MPTQGQRRPSRWTLTRPRDETMPVGSIDCLRRAVERLGPFAHKSCDDARRLRRGREFADRVCVSEELAFERVTLLATAYNRQRLVAQNAPRPKHVVDCLDKLETLAGELARLIPSLDDFTLHALQTAGTGMASFADVFEHPLMEQAAVDDLPAPTASTQAKTPSLWGRRLEALSQYANETRVTFLVSQGINSPDEVDKGGNTDLYKRLFGSPQWALVQGGWNEYDLFKSGQATGTEAGPFHLFLMDVFEYATGLEPEENSKLTFWLKRVSSANRRYKEIINRQKVLMQEQKSIRSSEMDTTSVATRFQEISAEWRALERQRMELWPALQPNSYPQDRAKKETHRLGDG
jgi:hypothetical protein